MKVHMIVMLFTVRDLNRYIDSINNKYFCDATHAQEVGVHFWNLDFVGLMLSEHIRYLIIIAKSFGSSVIWFEF